MVDGEWFVDFKRALSIRDFVEQLDQVVLDPSKPDEICWILEKKGHFTTRSLYRFMTHGGLSNRIAGHLWKCKLPLKIKLFLWQLVNNKLQCAFNLSKKKLKGSDKCCLCGVIETVDHIFFKCVLAKMSWSVIITVFGLHEFPTSIKNLTETWLAGKRPLPIKLILFIFAGFAWALWNTRNKMAIEQVFPKAPTDIIFIALSFMQRWSTLLKEKDRHRWIQIKEEIIIWMKAFVPITLVSTDI